MPNKNIESELRERVDAFVTDLAQLIRQSALQTVHEALGGMAPQASAGPRSAAPRRKAVTRRPTSTAAPARRAASASKSGRIRRSPEELEALGATFLEHVRANPGQRLEEISAGIRVPTKELKRPVQQLLEANLLRTEGQKRGTRYFAGSGGAKRAKKAGKKASSRKTAA